MNWGVTAMIDHMGITVSDLKTSREFYTQALSPLGYVLRKNNPGSVSFGVLNGHGKSTDPAGDFWLSEGTLMEPRVHFAFSAATRADVDAFFCAALAAGGAANGAPGLRPNFHPHYFAAFIIDLDGYNIEAVCHQK